MISVHDAIFLSALPHRSGFFAAGGWNNIPAPDSINLSESLGEYFSALGSGFRSQ